jgi:hypothetical protein
VPQVALSAPGATRSAARRRNADPAPAIAELKALLRGDASARNGAGFAVRAERPPAAALTPASAGEDEPAELDLAAAHDAVPERPARSGTR